MLARGTRIGAFEVTGSLGAGGMGEVYRARDTRLEREVAIKVLPASFAGDPDRLMRFEREAKTLASLNHPHIAQIYGLEQSGRHVRAGHGARGGRGPRRSASRAGRCRSTRRCRSRGRSPRRSKPRTSGHHPSRSQARQHQGAAGRHREGAGLRARRRRSEPRGRRVGSRRVGIHWPIRRPSRRRR